MTKYVESIIGLSDAFLKQAELSKDELNWLKSNPPIYNRPTKPGRSSTEIAEDIKKNPLKEWDVSGIKHTIKLLEKMIKIGRLKRTNISNLIGTVDFLKSILREI